jgi:hypothetical protein
MEVTMTVRRIRLSAKGLAKYIAASPSTQRRILQQFKYPTADEPFAMRLYYREATQLLRACIEKQHPSDWVRQRAIDLTASDRDVTPAAARRLRQNSDALLLFDRHFRKRPVEILPRQRFTLVFHDVAVGVVPDLIIHDSAGVLRVIKLQLGGPRPPDVTVKVITQCLFEAAVRSGFQIKPTSARYVDLPRNATHSAATAGRRVLRDIEAACETISQIWDSIPPPARTKRIAAA